MNEYRRTLAWRAGNTAAKQGKPITANNRQPGTIFYDDWSDGWGVGAEPTNAIICGDLTPEQSATMRDWIKDECRKDAAAGGEGK